MTPPRGPTLVILDTEIQKEEAGDMSLPIYTPPKISSISNSQAMKIAEKLANSNNPRINVGRLRSKNEKSIKNVFGFLFLHFFWCFVVAGRQWGYLWGL